MNGVTKEEARLIRGWMTLVALVAIAIGSAIDLGAGWAIMLPAMCLLLVLCVGRIAKAMERRRI